MRASDAEREGVVERLREASVEGRLTLAELTERTEAAYLAQTQAELAQLTSDLPGGAPHPMQAPQAYGRPSGSARQWIAAVLGDDKRTGTWRIDQGIGAVCVMGDITLDLRQAEVRTNQVDIMVICVMGDVKIIVPDGVDVDLSGMTFMGDKKVKVVEAPPGHNAPVVRVRAYVVMGDVKIIGDSMAKPVKRSWSAWTDWWLDRRRQIQTDPHPGLGHDRDSHRDLHGDFHRELRDDLRQMKRDASHAWREARRGSPPPPPPTPPTW
jgi:hypothetical protein